MSKFVEFALKEGGRRASGIGLRSFATVIHPTHPDHLSQDDQAKLDLAAKWKSEQFGVSFDAITPLFEHNGKKHFVDCRTVDQHLQVLEVPPQVFSPPTNAAPKTSGSSTHGAPQGARGYHASRVVKSTQGKVEAPTSVKESDDSTTVRINIEQLNTFIKERQAEREAARKPAAAGGSNTASLLQKPVYTQATRGMRYLVTRQETEAHRELNSENVYRLVADHQVDPKDIEALYRDNRTKFFALTSTNVLATLQIKDVTFKDLAEIYDKGELCIATPTVRVAERSQTVGSFR